MVSKNNSKTNTPKIIAHRGASFLSKENTLESFQRAIDMGADMVEIDVQLTKDDKLIVLHDVHIDRISEGTGLVRNFTLSDIRKIQIFGKEKIPTLDEVLDLVLSQVSGVVIDLKRVEAVPFLLKYLKNKEFKKKAIFSSFDKQAVKSIKKFDKNVKVGLLCWIATRGKIKFCKDNNFDYIHPNYLLLKRRVAKRIRKAGLGINVWTVNYWKSLRRVMILGVDGIITDRTKRVRKYIEKT